MRLQDIIYRVNVLAMDSGKEDQFKVPIALIELEFARSLRRLASFARLCSACDKVKAASPGNQTARRADRKVSLHLKAFQ